MSLYNLLFGENSDTQIILAVIGLKRCDIERFRNCWIDDKAIYVYTRTGGGNRDDYPNEKLTSNPYYLYDHDDSFDSTYATYLFKIPDEIAEDVRNLQDIEANGISGNLIKWINKTLKREQTEEDKYADAMDKSKRKFEYLMREGHLTRPQNGHTCIILSDEGAEAIFDMLENGESYYWAVPMKFDILIDDYIYDWDRKAGGKGQYRIYIEPHKEWELDVQAAQRYMDLFAADYPKAAKILRDRWGMYDEG